MTFNIINDDCVRAMQTMAAASIDAIVTDPPYGLSFMGKKWDYEVPSVQIWAECLRILKPGGHLLAFAGTRTQHRMAVRIEDAGFEIRDMIAWVYGSGFPKSLDVSKAIDKAAGVEREVVGQDTKTRSTSGKTALPTMGGQAIYQSWDIALPVTPEAKQWEGWGTALKPALEPITVARKPLIGTVAENVLQHGTGAINVDGARVGDTVETWPASRARPADGQPNALYTHRLQGQTKTQTVSTGASPKGRWPANLIHDGSNEVVGLFPETAPSKATPRNNGEFRSVAKVRDLPHVTHGHEDAEVSAARFFYCAKASKADREEGCEGLKERKGGAMSGIETREGKPTNHPFRTNHHPTVKPTELMRYLCRLVTPPNGTILDPFMGSGSTGKAAVLEGFNFIGIERDQEYFNISKNRIAYAKSKKLSELLP